MEEKRKGSEALSALQRLIAVADRREPPDLVLKHTKYVNVFSQEICEGDIALADGYIAGVGDYSGPREVDCTGRGVVLPGLMDAHIHLESTLVAPAEFARAVLPHGTTTVITDPHEIANVMGCGGIDYMLRETEGLPVDVRFLLPSCVPATPLDESGTCLTWADIDGFYAHPRVLGLAEVMNFPGVTAGDPEVLRKLLSARARGAVIDGHAPGLSGHALNAYVTAGVRSDHECSTLEEALEKLALGQSILLREGTAAHNLEALVGLLTPRYADRCLLCCDDRHPSDLLEEGHIDHLLRRATALGADPILAVRAATLNPARYFGLADRGAVAPGLRADLVLVEDLTSFHVLRVYVAGRLSYGEGAAALSAPPPVPALDALARDTFHLPPLTVDRLRSDHPLGILGLVPGELITRGLGVADGPDPERDLLKLVVVERHKNTGHVGLGLLRGYGLRAGAVATSVAHDSHNIITVGVSDADLAFAANRIAALHGGITVVRDGQVLSELPLPIAGLMSDRPLTEVNTALESCKAAALALGVSTDIDPFMTLSFLSLPVIPTLRLTTKGVFHVGRQAYL